MPDRGDLVAYDKTRRPTQTGAYKWHPVELSEEHALRAVAGGELVVTGPNGHPIRLKYERHVEHSDGNWTWIGRVRGAKPGVEAILTFGEKAVFGSIPYGDEEPLRLTMAAGRAWLMETDRAAIARMDNAATGPRKPDFLLPPKTLDAPMASGTLVSSAPQVIQAATATATSTVDVLLGYTSGFATRLGGQSQAVTRLTYLVDVTNQAYLNSQIDAQVRLVRTMQVDYPDATSNQTALYALTGVECTEQPNGSLSCTYVGPAASLQSLHTARDQYGADLVSLVRNFNDPENGGCGIAWLVGGAQNSIDASDADSGMSVVSDSNGSGFPDGGYVCRDETLAHELGHNMGSAHDRDTADGDDNVLQANEYGRYPYSFGYKTGPGGGDFFTIMAYSDKRDAPPFQQRYRVFSNPDITFCGGFACGVANQADNARSLRQTIPIISTFRAAAVVAPAYVQNDLDRDGKSDLLWFSGSSLAWWRMNGATVLGSGGQGAAGGLSIAATGDFDGDRRVDIVWQSTTGNLVVWRSTGDSFVVETIGAYPKGWTLVGAGDVDGDGRSDLLWHNGASLAWWHMNGATVIGSGGQSVGEGFSAVAAGDLDGDARVDLVWQSEGGSVVLWKATGGSFSPVVIGGYPQGWTLLGAADVDADGNADLLWFNGTTLAWWRMSGATVLGSGGQAVGDGFGLATWGDFDGDRRSDLVWTSESGALSLWRSRGDGFNIESIGGYPAGWTSVRPAARAQYKQARADRNGDARSDLLWHNGSTLAWWHLNGATILSTGGQGMGAGSQVLGSGDFDGNKRADLLWKDGSNNLQLWKASGSGFSVTPVTGYPTGWTMAAIADINGDGRGDVLWHNGTTLAWWHMNQATIVSSGGQSMGAGSSVLGAGDFDGDGRGDVLWLDASNVLRLWTARGTGFSIRTIGSYPAGWNLAAVADINGDDRADIVWHNGTTLAWWHMQESVVVSSGGQGMGAGSVVLAAINADGDGRTDIVWRDAANAMWLWSAQGSGFSPAPLASYPTGWTLVSR